MADDSTLAAIAADFVIGAAHAPELARRYQFSLKHMYDLLASERMERFITAERQRASVIAGIERHRNLMFAPEAGELIREIARDRQHPKQFDALKFTYAQALGEPEVRARQTHEFALHPEQYEGLEKLVTGVGTLLRAHRAAGPPELLSGDRALPTAEEISEAASQVEKPPAEAGNGDDRSR